MEGGGGGLYVPRLNFKPFHFAISEGSHVAVGISSIATDMRRYRKCLTVECLMQMRSPNSVPQTLYFRIIINQTLIALQSATWEYREKRPRKG